LRILKAGAIQEESLGTADAVPRLSSLAGID